MAGRRHDTQEIATKLRHAANLLANGESISAIANKLEISKQTLFRWRREYGSFDERLMAPRNRTRNAILDAAERLIAEEGMSVSLRRIMEEADVNIAAINYHFGDRDALINALVRRRLGIVVTAQLQRLDTTERESVPTNLQNLIHAFIGPPIEASLSDDPGWQNFSRFLVWLTSDPRMQSEELVQVANADLHPRFVEAFAKRLPNLSDRDVTWRYASMIAVMQAAMHNRERLRRLSDGAIGGENYSDSIATLMPALIALWEAPALAPEVTFRRIGIEQWNPAER